MIDYILMWLASGFIGSLLWFAMFQKYAITPRDKWENISVSAVFIPFGPAAIVSAIMMMGN